MIKKTVGLVIITLLVIISMGTIAYATPNDNDKTNPSLNMYASEEGILYFISEIPSEMLPYSEIEFVNDRMLRVIQGGFPTKDYEEYIDVDVYPKPVTGVKVTYASDGFIQDITYPPGAYNPFDDPKPSLDEIAANFRIWVVQKSWGAHDNTVYYDSTAPNSTNPYKWKGAGRATTFTDPIGIDDIPNTKGSVATHKDWDKCPANTIIEVTTINSSNATVTKNMTKTDKGTLPDAVIDIWKTGVEYWGYTWTASFSMPKTVTYLHN